jgi:hypothetical protein
VLIEKIEGLNKSKHPLPEIQAGAGVLRLDFKIRNGLAILDKR